MEPDPLEKALMWIGVAPKLCSVKSKTKCLCYLRNAFFYIFSVTEISIVICHNRKIGTRIRIYVGPGSGSTLSKCGSEDPHPLLRKGWSEDPDPLFPNVDPRIWIHIKMRWIRNAVTPLKAFVQKTLICGAMLQTGICKWGFKGVRKEFYYNDDPAS